MASFLDLFLLFFLALFTHRVEVNAKAISLLIDRDNILWQFFEAKHSLIFLPIYLEAAVGEQLKHIAQLHIFSEHFLLVKVLPAKHLSQLINPLIAPQYFKDIRLLSFPHSVLLLEHHLCAVFAFIHAGFQGFQVESKRANGGICSIFD